jgi:hypothetical protein
MRSNDRGLCEYRLLPRRSVWAGQDSKRAITLLRERLEKQRHGRVDAPLLAVLEGRRSGGRPHQVSMEREPELVFYLARHLAMLRRR